MTWSTMKPSIEDYELKERERICNLSREDLVREWLDGCSTGELFQIAYEALYEDDMEYDDDTLRHMLIKEIV